MEKDRTKSLIFLMLGVIVVMGLFLIYFVFVKPAIVGYAIDAQQQGIQYTVLSIMQQAAAPSCQAVTLTAGNDTMNLINLECLQPMQEEANVLE